jgi:heme O synthase-like polyprenyltransferase
MLPVQTTPQVAAWWVLLHVGATSLANLLLTALLLAGGLLATYPSLGWLYLVPQGLASLGLLILGIRLVGQPRRARALALFHASNIYLALVMLLICVGVLVA